MRNALIEGLRRVPWRFDFYQAMRLIECHYADRPRLGKSVKLSDDPPIRFGQAVTLDFPPGALADWESANERHPDRLKVHFFGLFGPNGPLPLHLTEYAYGQDRLHRTLVQGDSALTHFADMFHHRMLCLFYRAWAEAQPTVQHDRHGRGVEEDRFSRQLGSVFGLGLAGLRDRDAMPDRAKLLFAGHLACQTRHADGLRSILQEFFGVPARILEFVGEWMDIAPHEQTRLGRHEQAGLLGMSTVLGARVFGCQHKIRLVLGPLALVVYREMLPGRVGLVELTAVVRNYLGAELAWDVNLVLRHAEIPPLQLDGEGQLGWTTWLGTKPGGADGDDLTLNPFFRL